MHYIARIPETGVKFDSSIDRGFPLEFKIGEYRQIICLEEVVGRMCLNEIVKVRCPSKYAYGSQGYFNLVKPNQDLDYEIKLLEVDYYSPFAQYGVEQ